MNEWINKSMTLGGHAAMSHKKSGELCLFGSGGQIWEYSTGGYWAVVYMCNHEEKLLRGLNQKALDRLVKKIRVPKDPRAQLCLALERSAGQY